MHAPSRFDVALRCLPSCCSFRTIHWLFFSRGIRDSWAGDHGTGRHLHARVTTAVSLCVCVLYACQSGMCVMCLCARTHLCSCVVMTGWALPVRLPLFWSCMCLCVPVYDARSEIRLFAVRFVPWDNIIPKQWLPVDVRESNQGTYDIPFPRRNQNALQLLQQAQQLQQQVLSLASSPYGDSPLFRNSLTEKPKSERASGASTSTVKSLSGTPAHYKVLLTQISVYITPNNLDVRKIVETMRTVYAKAGIQFQRVLNCTRGKRSRMVRRVSWKERAHQVL